MAAPSIEELGVVKEFRKASPEIPEVADYSDLECLAWLRARDLNISKANEMLRNHLAWRKEMEMDKIIEWNPPEGFSDDFPYEVVGNDYKGHPILIVPFGEWDIRKRVNKGEGKEFVRYMAQGFEKVMVETKKSSTKVGREVTQFIYIADAANFSMRQLTSMGTVNTMLQVVNMFEANFPETLYEVYVVNASRIFHILFSMIKPLLSARTLGKVRVFTTPDKWQHVLLQSLPPAVMPLQYGGARTGRRISVGALPFKDRSLTERLSTSYITVEVGAGKKFELAFTVTQPSSRIVWTFETESYDIGFSINFNREAEVVAYRRCDAHEKGESGNVICQNPGDYFVIFDNTYSKLRGKMIHYLVDMLQPEDDYFQDAPKAP